MNSVVCRHYKGDYYTIVNADVVNTETGEKMVVYKDSYGAWWARPSVMFWGFLPDGRRIFTIEPSE